MSKMDHQHKVLYLSMHFFHQGKHVLILLYMV